MNKLENCIDFDDHLKELGKNDSLFKKEFEEGYQTFKLGALLKKGRLDANMTQEQLASRAKTTKNYISRLENHVKDAKISTLFRFARALGKKIEIHLV